MASKVLKVLKVLNFSGDGEGNTFTCTFTGAAAPWLGAKRPSPQRHHATPKGHPAPGTRPCAQGEGDLLWGQWFPARISRSSYDLIDAGGVNE